MIHDHLCPMVNGKPPFRDDVTDDCLACPTIAKAREDEGNRDVGMAVVHWDARHAWGLHDCMKSRKQSLRKGLWIGWAIGVASMLPVIVWLAVNP
jgi:hypothetical protein